MSRKKNSRKMGRNASTTFPLIVIFGVMMAFLMTFVFINVYDQQLAARVNEEAESLVERLAQTAFQSLSGGELVTVGLPSNLGGSPYTVEVQDNRTFVVNVTAGRLKGKTFTSVANVRIALENSEFTPGGSVFFLRSGEDVIVSSSEIQIQPENVFITPSSTPPPFYDFAKENAREAAGISAAYFDFKTKNPGTGADASAFKWEDENLLVQISENGSPLTAIRLTASENSSKVGVVENSWVVALTENAENFQSEIDCPSIENAYSNGWYHSPSSVLDHLRSRTWRKTSDNVIISVPAYAEISAAAATTNVSTYPTWRVTFDEYVIFFRGMPWWEFENTAGFIFQSDPTLYAVV